jgi:hypothetical protein
LQWALPVNTLRVITLKTDSNQPCAEFDFDLEMAQAQMDHEHMGAKKGQIFLAFIHHDLV